MKIVFMCRPCAEQLKAEGKATIHTSVKDKGTCECCKRRRFGYNCTVKEGVV